MFHTTCWVDITLDSPAWTVRLIACTVHVVPARIMQLLEWGTLRHITSNIFLITYFDIKECEIISRKRNPWLDFKKKKEWKRLLNLGDLGQYAASGDA